MRAGTLDLGFLSMVYPHFPEPAEVVAELRRRGSEVATGVFGARMLVSSVNEGPMTLLLEV